MPLIVFPIVAFLMLIAGLTLAGVRRPLAWATLTFGSGFFLLWAWIIFGGYFLSQAHQAAAELRCEATAEQATKLFGHPPIDYRGLAGGPLVPCSQLAALGFKDLRVDPGN